MCRERDVERQGGSGDTGRDTLPSIQQPPGEKELAGSKGSSASSDREQGKAKQGEKEKGRERDSGRPILWPRSIAPQVGKSSAHIPSSGSPGKPSIAPAKPSAGAPRSASPVPRCATTAQSRTAAPPTMRTICEARSTSPASRCSASNAPSGLPTPGLNPSHTRSASPVLRATSSNARIASPAPRAMVAIAPRSASPAPRGIATPPSGTLLPVTNSAPSHPRSSSPALKCTQSQPRSSSPLPKQVAPPSLSCPPSKPQGIPSIKSAAPPVRRSASPVSVRKESRPGPIGDPKAFRSDAPRRLSSTEPGISSTRAASKLSPISGFASGQTSRASSVASENSDYGPESPTLCSKKQAAVEFHAQRRLRIAGYGRKSGTPKAGRVACEGMIPVSPPVKEKKRCSWITHQSDPAFVAYHDEEWGVPVHDDKFLFELLVLEGAQAELSRPTLLGLRDYFRSAFAGFDPELVAKFDEKRIMALSWDADLRQPEAKIRGTVENAKQFLKIVEECGSFSKYVWSFVGCKPIVNTPRNFTQIPAKSSKSETLSKDLMKRGFRYVGPTTIYSFMQAAGLVNDHLVSCFRHTECCKVVQALPTVGSCVAKIC